MTTRLVMMMMPMTMTMMTTMMMMTMHSSRSLSPMMTDWRQLRRLYIYAMTRHQQGILRRCQNVLFSEEAEKKYGRFDLKALMRATTLHQIDELYSHKRAGFKTCEEYYKWASSASYIDQVRVSFDWFWLIQSDWHRWSSISTTSSCFHKIHILFALKMLSVIATIKLPSKPVAHEHHISDDNYYSLRRWNSCVCWMTFMSRVMHQCHPPNNLLIIV